MSLISYRYIKFVCVCVCGCICVHVCVLICVYVHTYMLAYSYVHICICAWKVNDFFWGHVSLINKKIHCSIKYGHVVLIGISTYHFLLRCLLYKESQTIFGSY